MHEMILYKNICNITVKQHFGGTHCAPLIWGIATNRESKGERKAKKETLINCRLLIIGEWWLARSLQRRAGARSIKEKQQTLIRECRIMSLFYEKKSFHALHPNQRSVKNGKLPYCRSRPDLPVNCLGVAEPHVGYGVRAQNFNSTLKSAVCLDPKRRQPISSPRWPVKPPLKFSLHQGRWCGELLR